MKTSNPTIEVSAYFTASIRGEKGSNASKRDIRRNIEVGKKVAAKISNYFGSMLNMYVPHNQDDLIQILWYAGKISVWDILDGDCKIVAEKELLIAYAPKDFLSTGMQREIKAAEEIKIPVVIFEEFTDEIAITILEHIHQIIKRKMQAIGVGKVVEDLRKDLGVECNRKVQEVITEKQVKEIENEEKS